ncbi:hypothetical protein [Methylorubrum zatmanii]
MRTAGEILDGLARELFEDGTDVLTIDAIERRQREFATAAWNAGAGTPQHVFGREVAAYLRGVAQALRVSAFRL